VIPDLAGQLLVEVPLTSLGNRWSSGSRTEWRPAARLRFLGLNDYFNPPDVFERLRAHGVGQGVAGGERR
jgi:hypothetical protein